MTDKPLAEKARDWERPLDPERDTQAAPLNPPPTLDVADTDVLIQRDDLGEGVATLVAAGDPVPAELAGLPRRPRTEPHPRKRG
jgi:hypothetical protein